jgi:hypothetical protein
MKDVNIYLYVWKWMYCVWNTSFFSLLDLYLTNLPNKICANRSAYMWITMFHVYENEPLMVFLLWGILICEFSWNGWASCCWGLCRRHAECMNQMLDKPIVCDGVADKREEFTQPYSVNPTSWPTNPSTLRSSKVPAHAHWEGFCQAISCQAQSFKLGK